MKARSLLAAGMWLIACGGGSGEGASSPEGGGEAEAQEETSDESETAYERKLRLAKERLDQCNTLVEAVQSAEKPSRNIVNLNDSTTMNFLAKAIDRSAKPVHALSLSIEDLEQLRQRYADDLKKMAEALRETAATPDEQAKKNAIARYRELDKDSSAAVDAINQACSGEPAEEPTADAP
jgi:hypothetical protein